MRKFLALAAMLAAAATPAFADAVEFEGAEIVIGAPDGYCDIGSGDMSGLLLTDDPGDILIGFARCEEVEAAAGGRDYRSWEIGPFGVEGPGAPRRGAGGWPTHIAGGGGGGRRPWSRAPS